MENSKKINIIEDDKDEINVNDITEFNTKDSHVIEDDILVDDLSHKKIDDYIPEAEVLEISDEITKDQKKKEVGLTSQEAEALLAKYGPNKLVEKKKQSKFFIFFKQLKDVMILLLFIAMTCSIAVAIVNGIKESWNFAGSSHLVISLVEPLIILVVIVMYCILGGIQELKSQRL
ncbi:cation-transporting p-type ATPase [Malacoplasma penetrans HF-2]|uniref:Cation-transporting p-type ATPase n=1 Tax=Malacoplasma penetrans (strain HF-2) TaxID=272633 RepID=Q8EW79_MALP2|nr:cation-transporting P-type ATPase [Malacoplasma penetrans]BAC44117.1 cation-transporting p-type ATPase [Malacoplasma penetrans HF-2]